jgi:hypothetical protein
MIKKPQKYSFEIALNGQYDTEGKPLITKVCFIPKSIRVESNERETFKTEVDRIKENDVFKLRDELYKATKDMHKDVIIEMYLTEKNENFKEMAKTLVIEDGKNKKEYEKKLKQKTDFLIGEEREKIKAKEDVEKEIQELLDIRCNIYVVSKAVTRTLLYTFSECIRTADDPLIKLFKDANDVEDCITEDDMTMLCDKWREFREGMEEDDAKK